MNRSEKWDKEESTLTGRSKFTIPKKKSQTKVPCSHETGVMIPQINLKGKYVKPEFMICDNCRLVLKKEI